MSIFKDLWTGETIGSALRKACDRYGSREAMVFENGSVTYDQLNNMSGLVARGLLSLGVQRGDRLAIWMASYVEWAYLYYAAARIGAIMVPVNTRYKAFEVEYVLNKSKAGLLVFKDEGPRGKNYAGVLREIAPELDQSSSEGFILERLPYLRRVIAIAGETSSGCLTFAQLLRAGSKVSLETLSQAEGKVKPEDDALIQFTSGTTALPKGAILYQNAMLRGAYYNNDCLGATEGVRFFSPQPFYHVGGSIQVMLGPVVNGCTIIVQTYFNTAGALRLMEEHSCTVTMGHQPHWIEYLNHPDLKKRKLHLRSADIFAPPDVRKRVHEEMGIEFLNSPYGMSETHLGGTSCRFDDSIDKWMNTVGKSMPGLELVIRDPETNHVLSPGKTGEACFRGWSLMKGYYDDPEKTAEAIDNEGWLRTGDLAAIDEEGYLHLVGRIKDMIRVGGENVAAGDVEDFLLHHDKVKQTVVIGGPDDRLGEVCIAFIELKNGMKATEEDFISYCKAGLAGFKVPRKVIFLDKWPMSGTGKIQKVVLQKSVGEIVGSIGK
jgi:acyl-CoA synthetase (AMP-forming)/AMP-acid ligase II